MDWDPNNKLEQATHHTIKQCHGVGIWPLLWKGKKGNARAIDGDGANEVGEYAWEVVRWLVGLWERDQQESTDSQRSSRGQLPGFYR